MHLIPFRPYIYQKNTTRFAKLVDKIVREGEMHSFSMNSREPLEILVEIGIEKLRRDHVHALLSSSFAGRDELEPYMKQLSTSNW